MFSDFDKKNKESTEERGRIGLSLAVSSVVYVVAASSVPLADGADLQAVSSTSKREHVLPMFSTTQVRPERAQEGREEPVQTFTVESPQPIQNVIVISPIETMDNDLIIARR